MGDTTLELHTTCHSSLNIELNKVNERLDAFEAKIEKRPAVTGNRTQDTLACAASVLPLSYDNRTTTEQPLALTILYIYCTGGTDMPQSHTRQPCTQYVLSEPC